ncbi:MAG: hypothetical protein JO156_07970 [Solirubrobacterales bacterium]|nr:hypothetical protein [Solirubrobacterales bacterium]
MAAPSRLTRWAISLSAVRSTILIYLGTRALLLLVASLDDVLRHHAFNHELANWDGLWYRELAAKGYPTSISHLPTTLGFFPLYPTAMWAVAHAAPLPDTIANRTFAGVLVSGVGGLAAAVLVHRLAAGWWGERSGRRAGALFCLFPGSVVFSMAYAEGLMLPLAAGCILALERRRWIIAGVLAGLATATEPEALALIPVCAVSAALELRRRGWNGRGARRSLFAPALSLTGVVAFAAFLWSWTGTPVASLRAQRYGWHERTDPLALVHLARGLARELSFSHFNHPTINLNLVVGLLGAAILTGGLVLLFRTRRQVSVEALVWTVGISLLALTSEYTPPNPRLLITAFPAVVVIAHFVKGRKYLWLACANAALLAGMSSLTFIGTTLRP